MSIQKKQKKSKVVCVIAPFSKRRNPVIFYPPSCSHFFFPKLESSLRKELHESILFTERGAGWWWGVLCGSWEGYKLGYSNLFQGGRETLGRKKGRRVRKKENKVKLNPVLTKSGINIVCKQSEKRKKIYLNKERKKG